jgi:HlyD family type I secretion membrane fusion protein
MDTRQAEWGPSDEAADVLLARPPRLIGGSVVLLTVGVAALLVAGYFASVEVVVAVPGGVIRPAGDLVMVQPAIDGRVVDVRVREGDAVRTGDILFRIDRRDANSDLDKVLSQKQEVDRQLECRRRASESLEREEEAARRREQLELEGAHLRLTKAESDRTRAAAAVREAEARVVEVRAAYEPAQELQKSGITTQQELRLLKARLDVALADEEKAQTDLNGADVETDLARRAVPAMSAGAAESGERRRRELEQARSEINDLEEQSKRLLLESERLRSRLDEFDLRASVDGTVTSVPCRNAGQYVEAGATLAAIAPDGVPWVLELLVPDRDVGLLPRKTGSSVKIKFDAFPFLDYGTLPGKLEKVDPDAIWRDGTGRVYRATVSLESRELRQGDRVGHVRLGMQATGEIVKERERILALLLRKARDTIVD